MVQQWFKTTCGRNVTVLLWVTTLSAMILHGAVAVWAVAMWSFHLHKGNYQKRSYFFTNDQCKGTSNMYLLHPSPNNRLVYYHVFYTTNTKVVEYTNVISDIKRATEITLEKHKR